ncbi:hypothetical protein IF1G_05011 [Cordyceps javanica]|uniref:Secreted protein n=1 Tax=Cordyceps javanica TaxID=43265 RepID=A0A545V3Y8_9HYPO|nr:hypothetical protein IF1G_05011 [Cordyceps javanica]
MHKYFLACLLALRYFLAHKQVPSRQDQYLFGTSLYLLGRKCLSTYLADSPSFPSILLSYASSVHRLSIVCHLLIISPPFAALASEPFFFLFFVSLHPTLSFLAIYPSVLLPSLPLTLTVCLGNPPASISLSLALLDPSSILTLLAAAVAVAAAAAAAGPLQHRSQSACLLALSQTHPAALLLTETAPPLRHFRALRSIDALCCAEKFQDTPVVLVVITLALRPPRRRRHQSSLCSPPRSQPFDRAT